LKTERKAAAIGGASREEQMELTQSQQTYQQAPGYFKRLT
jgi:hypothetical protein